MCTEIYSMHHMHGGFLIASHDGCWHTNVFINEWWMCMFCNMRFPDGVICREVSWLHQCTKVFWLIASHAWRFPDQWSHHMHEGFLIALVGSASSVYKVWVSARIWRSKIVMVSDVCLQIRILCLPVGLTGFSVSVLMSRSLHSMVSFPPSVEQTKHNSQWFLLGTFGLLQGHIQALILLSQRQDRWMLLCIKNGGLSAIGLMGAGIYGVSRSLCCACTDCRFNWLSVCLRMFARRYAQSLCNCPCL